MAVIYAITPNAPGMTTTVIGPANVPEVGDEKPDDVEEPETVLQGLEESKQRLLKYNQKLMVSVSPQKEKITFDEVMSGDFSSFIPDVTWINDHQLLYRDQSRHLIKMDVSVVESRQMLSKDFFKRHRYFSL